MSYLGARKARAEGPDDTNPTTAATRDTSALAVPCVPLCRPVVSDFRRTHPTIHEEPNSKPQIPAQNPAPLPPVTT
jgi:hypothetical protein